ncbi:hypothetical protein SNOG_14162 [Parastagonospora nodorum SN15]|uniref:Ig-like domain-containing protein n=1 Tax=Phaeosphaeria nodorum (strain SN15 / ATCC MYA-4574 / FGSC 10173) TaxID=321614 RepID=Q0U1Z8_PHANO|nr:hypothetical protein SNOG_14162 [Parastagonospora nodorum SN15]EAT78399.1 hypothetical protein SNOG_14162 [Parastagonospora nodorum SN15]
MTSAMCSICAHLDMVKGEKWNPWTVGWPKITIEILQQSASLCQTDGCKILLQAVLKCYPDASTTAGIVPYYKPGIFWVQELGELQIYFKMGEDYSCSTVLEIQSGQLSCAAHITRTQPLMIASNSSENAWWSA